jgi:hypothetical protein
MINDKIIVNSIQFNALNNALIYSHTLENKSSLAANPPAAGLLPLPAVVVVLLTGAALVHPPKSSSGATVAAVEVVVAAGAPQPAPMSRGVKVLGILIDSAMEECADVVGFAAGGAGAGAGAGSGVLQAFPPHGSMLDEENMLVTFDVEVVGAAFWAGLVVVVDERLKTDEVG